MPVAAPATIFRWEDPAPTGKGQYHPRPIDIPDEYADIAAQLKANPNRWAIVAASDAQGSAANLSIAIKTGRTSSWCPGGAFQALTRRRGDLTLVFARYIAATD